jgi:hypothetical protein
MPDDTPITHPSFRQEDQHMAANLKPIVVGPPAYASPDPSTNAGALVPVDEHPFDLDKDYGASAPKTVDITLNSDALNYTKPSVEGDREEWTKDQWSSKAEEYGIPKSGTKDEIRERVEAYEDDPSQFDNNNEQ